MAERRAGSLGNFQKVPTEDFATREDAEISASEGLQEAIEELVGGRFEQRMMGVEL